MGESMIVIGAGVAGLSTGCYAQMNAYQTRIFEMHGSPGGLCTSWDRQGYTIDGCIHWLIGAGPASRFDRVWRELGAVQKRPMVYHDEFLRLEDPEGRALVVYTDIDRFAEHLRSLSPADKALVDTFASAAHQFEHIDLFSLPLLTPWQTASALLPRIGPLIKWSRMSMADFGSRFSDPFLQRMFPEIHGFPPLPMSVHLTNLAGMHRRQAGWPIGGSRAFARAIAERYESLGGRALYRSRVTEILTEPGPRGRDRAVGVRLEDGSEHLADFVVSAADGRSTIFRMLGGRYTNERIRDYYAREPEGGIYGLHVALGVNRDLSAEPHHITVWLKEPTEIGGWEQTKLMIEHFCFDPSMAAEGKSVLNVYLDAAYPFWKALHDEGEAYRAEKKRVAETVIALLDRRFPGISGQVEMVDVATPATTERYTGNWMGAQAYPPAGGMAAMLSGVSPTLPKLANFYMVGQWALGISGLPTSAASGRKLIRDLCRRRWRRFKTSLGTYGD